MPTLNVEFELKCGECGQELDMETKTDGWGITITVQPCSQCLETARDDGRDQGYTSGREDAEADHAAQSGRGE